MAIQSDQIRETLFVGADAKSFRPIALVAAFAVVATNWLLGGRWLRILIGLGVVASTCLILPARLPSDRIRLTIMRILRAAYAWPLWLRLGCGVLLILAVSVLTNSTRLPVGSEFNLYLVPIFLSSLLFGLPVAVATWLLSFSVAYYYLIPPKYSFEVLSLKDFALTIGYFYLGLLALAIPALVRASSAAFRRS